MAPKPKSTKTASAETPQQAEDKKSLPETNLTGVNAKNTKTVLVSAVLEVTGQVRFGDGTDVGLTVTETDMVISPDGSQVHKLIWAGSKRRGVDRRTIHELRDHNWNRTKCYIPELCGECPVCWLYGFTGTTQQKEINAKSRVLYATSVSVEEVQKGLNVHSRNQVDEKAQTTAGAAGIHEEQIIVAGVHFPTYTALIHVIDWEIGAFAHALLENVNSNRYTAASRGQGGMKFAVQDDKPLIVVDESPHGIFPLAVPKIAGWETDWQQAQKVFQAAMNAQELKSALEAQGFTVKIEQVANASEPKPLPASPTPTGSAPEEQVVNTSESNTAKQPSQPTNQLSLKESTGMITVEQNGQVVMTRYVGKRALGYLREKQLAAKQQFGSLDASKFMTEIQKYIAAISPKQRAGTASAGESEGTEGGDEGENE
jgi:hypothetical protein